MRAACAASRVAEPGQRLGLDREQAGQQDGVLAGARRRRVAVGQRDRDLVLAGAERQRREVHPGLGGAHVVRAELAARRGRRPGRSRAPPPPGRARRLSRPSVSSDTPSRWSIGRISAAICVARLAAASRFARGASRDERRLDRASPRRCEFRMARLRGAGRGPCGFTRSSTPRQHARRPRRGVMPLLSSGW